MIKKTKEIVEIREERTVKAEAFCDVCGRLIYEDVYSVEDYFDRITNQRRVRSVTNRKYYRKENERCNYWVITTGHNDWGNDSCESTKEFHACSPGCVMEKLKEYISKSDTAHGARGNTEYIEIEHSPR